ncbi:pirin family protein [Ferruginibacter sp. SUN106]|uniref:pirin family protein n=1 Tax=Ferruginibacter sp. SUN106 TaxID=2978348 RepID=UPI003D362D37
MAGNAKAIIHLNDNRGHLENEWMRSLVTFNFGNYKTENREPFGSLQVFNEDTLAAGKSINMLVEENTEVLIVPLTGTIFFKDHTGNETYINPGQVQLFAAVKQSSYQIINPYENEELVNFLQVWLYKSETVFIPKMQLFNFDLSQKNQLHTVITASDLNQQAYTFIGKYDGRQKGIYSLQNKNNGIYCFVIEGAFEIQDRLLHAKDGLAIWDTDEIDFEALSNGAIVLLFEIPLYCNKFAV